MLNYIILAEKQLASLLHILSAKIAQIATSLESAPISNQCTTTFSTLSSLSQQYFELSNTLFSQLPSFSDIPKSFSSLYIIPIALFVSLILVFFIPVLIRFIFGTDPHLASVPAPSHLYDPNVDEQSDLFCDDDVRPQLSRTGHTCINPATGQNLGSVTFHSQNDVVQAIERARAAQSIWALTSFSTRKTVLRVLKEYILYEQRSLTDISCADTGKTPLDASLGEILPTLEKIRWLLEEGEQAISPEKRSTGALTKHKIASLEFMPMGVIAAIAPWNYPIHNFFNPVLAALFSGNAIVVKPSEYTIYSSLHCVRIIRRALALCGHSPELVQLVIGGADVGETLVNSDIDKLFFTGSTKVGKIVAEVAGKKLLPTCLELGGKDPFIVADDVNVNHVVDICLRGVFQNSGQNCIGVERVFVHEKIVNEFVRLALERVKAMRLGTDLGAMTMGERGIEVVQQLVDDAVSKGAKLIHGGRKSSVGGNGTYYEPTILKGVTKDMRIAKEEVFGPVLSIFTWTRDNDLIEAVNDCPFALGSSVFCNDEARAEKIFAQVKAGMGNINDFATNYLCQSMPFGGTKESGSDRFAGIEGLRGCCIPKATTRDKYKAIKTFIPKNLRYPISANAYEFASELNSFFYNTGSSSKIDSVRNLAGMSIFKSWRPRTTSVG